MQKQPLRWLMLRGLARQNGHWFEFVPLMQKHHEQILCLDLPGFGTENGRSSPISMDGIVEDVRDRFLKIKKTPDEQWGLLGMSLGGMVALQWFETHPNDFVLGSIINTSSRDSGNLLERLLPFGMYKSLEATLHRNDLRAKELAILQLISNLRKDDQKLLDQMVRMAEERPSTLINFTRQLLAASRFVAPEHIEKPILFLASLKDHMVNVRCTKQLAENYKQKIKYHATAGHDLTLDDPEWVTDRIVEFELEVLGKGPSHPM